MVGWHFLLADISEYHQYRASINLAMGQRILGIKIAFCGLCSEFAMCLLPPMTGVTFGIHLTTNQTTFAHVESRTILTRAFHVETRLMPAAALKNSWYSKSPRLQLGEVQRELPSVLAWWATHSYPQKDRFPQPLGYSADVHIPWCSVKYLCRVVRLVRI